MRSQSALPPGLTGSALTAGVIAAIQTFGNRINFHPHLHFLVTEGGVDEAGIFHLILRMEIFARPEREEVWMNPAATGPADGSRVARPPAQAVLDRFRSPIYASS